MPIYEFMCEDCGRQFERLVRTVRNGSAPSCPHCHSPTKKKLSIFAAHSDRKNAACGLPIGSCSATQQQQCSSRSCPYSQH